MQLTTIPRYYFRVADVAAAFDKLVSLGFAQLEEKAPFRDPVRPPSVDGDQGEAFLRTVSDELQALARFGLPVNPRIISRWSHHLTYWTYQPWPTCDASSQRAMTVARRVEGLCIGLGVKELTCIPDRNVHITELSSDEVASRTFTIGELDPHHLFRS